MEGRKTTEKLKRETEKKKDERGHLMNCMQWKPVGKEYGKNSL